MDKRTRLAFTVIALGMIATSGLWEGARGLILPRFLGEAGVTPALGSAIFSAGSLGYFVSSLAFGTLTRRWGLRRLTLVGAIVTALMFALFLTQRPPAVLYGAMAVLGAGMALVELSTSLPISLLYGEAQGGMLNLLHGCFGLGTLAGTLWIAMWFSLGVGWRLPSALVAVLIAVWMTGFHLLPKLELPPEPSAHEGGFGTVLKDPFVWGAALSLCAAVVGEAGSGLFLPLFLQRVKGLSEESSALYATVFFAGFTGTRLAGSYLVGKVGPARLIVILSLTGAVGLAGIILLPGSFAWLSALAGAGVAITFATSVALVATRYPAHTGQVYSLMYSAGGVAGILTGPLMGWVGQAAGMTPAMCIPLAACLAVAGLMATVGRRRAAPAEAERAAS